MDSSKGDELVLAVCSLVLGGVIVWTLYDTIDPVKDDPKLLFVVCIASILGVYAFLRQVFSRLG